MITRSAAVTQVVPKTTSVSVTFPSLSNPGYTAIWGRIKPGSYCDYVTINESSGAITLGNGTASIGTVYFGNWSASEKTAQAYFEVLWVKN